MLYCLTGEETYDIFKLGNLLGRKKVINARKEKQRE